MDTLETVLLILLVVDAIALVGLVLIQQSKGADVGAAFGSGTAGTMFGPSGGASFLVKLTTILAILFFVLTFALAYTAKQRADRLGGVDFRDEPATTEVETGVPDIGTEIVVDETTELEGDEIPILPSSGAESDEIPTQVESSDADEDSGSQQ